MTESRVVIATPEWEDGIWALLKEMHAETALFPLDEKIARVRIRQGLQRNRAIVGAIGTPDRVEASLGLFSGNFWYTNANYPHLEDFWQYVGQEYRKSKHARALLDWAEFVQKEVGVPVLLGIMSTKRTEAKVELCKRHLGPNAMVGALFMLGVSA